MRKLILGLFFSSLLLTAYSCRETEMNTDGDMEEQEQIDRQEEVSVIH